MTEILIPNLGIGNFASVLRMVQKVGGSARLVGTPAELAGAEKVILAGVGAFDTGMQSIRVGGWTDALSDVALARKRPVLGICLGMQLMCSGSEEGRLPGLGWMDAKVRRFAPPAGSGLKVPHMGWSPVRVVRDNALIDRTSEEQRFYFVHSYYIECRRPDDAVAVANYGHDFTAVFSRGNMYGVQFHPEKSHRFGMGLMKHFVEL